MAFSVTLKEHYFRRIIYLENEKLKHRAVDHSASTIAFIQLSKLLLQNITTRIIIVEFCVKLRKPHFQVLFF